MRKDSIEILEGSIYGNWKTTGKIKIFWHEQYYECICTCGTIRYVRKSLLISGKSTACGCTRSKANSQRMKGTSPPNKLKGYEASLNKVLYMYKYSAKKKGLLWDLSEELCRNLFLSKCHYCGIMNSNTIRSRPSAELFIYNGIDRIDSNKGYTKDNVVSCCCICNKAKTNMSKEEFLSWVSRVYKHSCTGDRCEIL